MRSLLFGEDDGIFWQTAGNPPGLFSSEAHDVLFSTGDSRLRTIFHRDAAGSVTEMLVRNENRTIVYQRER